MLSKPHPASGLDRGTLVAAAALAALLWSVITVLHEGLGHGAACAGLGGRPEMWGAFHFTCARDSLSVPGWRAMAAAGTGVNLLLLALGALVWTRAQGPTARFAGWLLVMVNGLTSFGYLMVSAVFGFGDWNMQGVFAGVTPAGPVRAGVALAGLAGYAAFVRWGTGALGRLLPGPRDATRRDARALLYTVWLTLGAVSVVAELLGPGGLATRLGPALGAALGGNAGLLTVASRAGEGRAPGPFRLAPSPWLLGAAGAAVAVFALVFGPGLDVSGGARG